LSTFSPKIKMKGNLPKWQSVWTFSLEGLGILKMYNEFLVPGQFFILLIKSFTGVQGAVLQKSPLAGHTDVVNMAVYSRDGKKILSTSVDHTIKEWDAGTGECLKTHKKDDHPDLS
jgi:WD40 repeat protein